MKERTSRCCRIEADELTALSFGNSEELEVGDFVLAIGNPFGIGQTVTSGIVSALGRTGVNRSGYEDFIQTDASINPGNSGGALVDLDGKLIGINSAIMTPAGGNVGIGFAVPTAMAREVMDQLIEYGEVRRGQLGIHIQDVTPSIAEALNLDAAEGALISQVVPGSAAEQAGLQAGDVILEIDGRPVDDSSSLRNMIGLMRLGTGMEITFIRDGERRRTTAKTGLSSNQILAESEAVNKFKGAEFRDLDPSHPRYDTVEGVLVDRVEEGSPAERNGLRQGDIVTAVNRVKVRSVAEFSKAAADTGGAICAQHSAGERTPVPRPPLIRGRGDDCGPAPHRRRAGGDPWPDRRQVGSIKPDRSGPDGFAVAQHAGDPGPIRAAPERCARLAAIFTDFLLRTPICCGSGPYSLKPLRRRSAKRCRLRLQRLSVRAAHYHSILLRSFAAPSRRRSVNIRFQFFFDNRLGNSILH